jgi:dTDP-4-amino-4,6-dideoxygalactose transaminase
MNAAIKPHRIDFIDLAAQRRAIGEPMEQAILDVVRSGQYIFGPQVAECEKRLAAFSGARHAIGCANGTDAIGLVLMAMQLRPGDAVLCPSFTFAATAEVVAWLGATPVFVDIDPVTFNMDPDHLPVALASAQALGLKTRAVIAVDLFGQPADYDRIEPFCAANGLMLIADTAQGFGATYKGRVAGSIGDFATTSFFPAKPLGCYGDGGAVFTRHDGFVEPLRSLLFHGKGEDRYDNIRIGVNSRLDTIQAAVLLQKLNVFAAEINARQMVARRYADGLSDVALTPAVLDGCISTWAQYVLRVPAGARAGFIEALKGHGVPTAVYYPKPLHKQTAYSRFPVGGNGVPVSERLAHEVVALPMHAYLEEATQDWIIEAVRDALKGTGPKLSA